VSDVGEPDGRLRVLIFTQYFVPEVTAARVRMEAFASGLVDHGHQVEVICEVPNHPEGIVDPEFRHKPIVKRRLGGVDVRYVWVRASPRKNVRNRLAMYGSYAAMAAVAGSIARRPDVILASSPPLFVGAAAAAAAARHRAPWVFDVRDLWPEAAVSIGELSGRPARMAEWLERRLYRSAEQIVVTSAAYRPHIERWVPADRISVVPNGTSKAALVAGEAEVSRASVGLPDEGFVWMYAGNLGVLQGLESLVDAAGELGDGFQLEFVGDGPMREQLRERAAAGTGRVSFMGLVPPDEAARLSRAADALVVSLDAHPAMAKCVPSKLFDSAAAGRPVVLAANGESRRLVEESGAALCVPPNDHGALAAAIRRLREEPALRQELAEKGRRFAELNGRDRGIEALESALISAMRRRRERQRAS
jgi:glycosyltransferase involved in cell wall biosynthesis